VEQLECWVGELLISMMLFTTCGFEEPILMVDVRWWIQLYVPADALRFDGRIFSLSGVTGSQSKVCFVDLPLKSVNS
jgi:hypothetical protein